MRLVSISMVRNEADVIEAFVRHHIEIVDLMILIDHRSIDGTPDILEGLRAEGAPIEVRSHDDPVLQQSRVSTSLMRYAAGEHGADWVLPLDADEFLASDDEPALRPVFEKLPGQLHRLPWRSYVPLPDDDLSEPVLLARIQHRCRQEVRPVHKVVVPGNLAGREDLALGVGNHALREVGRGGSEIEEEAPHELPTKEVPGTHLAHFPLRSVEQLTAKGLLGWVARLTASDQRGSANHHLRGLFEKISSGRQPLTAHDLRDFALGYAVKRGPVPTELDRVPVRSPGAPIELRYSDGSFDLDLPRALAELAANLGQQLVAERERSLWSRIFRRSR